MVPAVSHPLPRDSLLRDAAIMLRDSGHWGYLVDAQWNSVYATDEIRRTFGGQTMAEWPLAVFFFGTPFLATTLTWRYGGNTLQSSRTQFRELGGWVLADLDGGRDELRQKVAPELADLVDGMEILEVETKSYLADGMGVLHSNSVPVPVIAERLRDASGRLAGTVFISKPALGMHTIGSLTSHGDLRHFEQMLEVSRPERRSAAVLFADLDASAPLSRRLSTSSYFGLVRRLVTETDQCVVDAGGMVGRHVGDGVVAFFVAEHFASESAAARASIEAVRALRNVARDVADRCELSPTDVVLRFGVHWGSTLYVGAITTVARSEVTALGDEVNEAARIEACASGGRALVSKELIERLDRTDAEALGLNPDQETYTLLGELSSATEKARRDAPNIAVCEI